MQYTYKSVYIIYTDRKEISSNKNILTKKKILNRCIHDINVYTSIYLNCANYWSDKLSYRFEEVCDLRGGGSPKKTCLSWNSY